MPATMIHLLIAREVEPKASDLFWVGNFAPDYTDEREFKDRIHLRDIADRDAALKDLKARIDISNDFERGWLLHLFADFCWDIKEFIDYKNWAESTGKTDNWFSNYREEGSFVTFYLYHNLPWSSSLLNQIKAVDIGKIKTSLPVTLQELGLYRDVIYKKHTESDANIKPRFYTENLLTEFAKTTAYKYREWIE